MVISGLRDSTFSNNWAASPTSGATVGVSVAASPVKVESISADSVVILAASLAALIAVVFAALFAAAPPGIIPVAESTTICSYMSASPESPASLASLASSVNSFMSIPATI